ncbi:MAG TPA: sensor histidine kinase [Solirubrobacterales bacterium]|nr:sensor histidine kinase [Solirubrobacterales bacterium]
MTKSERDVEAGPGFRHEALIYEGPEQFLAVAVPFLSAALAGGEPALVAVRQANAELLRAELGPEAQGVGFVSIEEVGRNPARIVSFWRDFLAGQAGSSARGISEPVWLGREAAEIEECQRHEHLLNLAFPPEMRPSLLCSYDGSALPDEVLDGVFRSHRAVLRDGSRELSSSYRRECDCYSGKLPRHPDDAETLPYNRARLAAVRKRVKEAAEQTGIGPLKAADLVAAASELAANSVVHGGGTGTMSIWREGNYLLIDFEDRGTIEEPLAGRLHPATDQRGGRGLWLANQLCDLVQIRSGALGTTVRVQAAVA